MAFTFTSETNGKGGSWTLQQGFNLTASVYVLSDAPAGPEAFLRSLGLNVGATYRWPLTGTPVETNSGLFLQGIAADFDDDGKGARLTATFAPFDPSKDDKGPVDEDGNRDPFSAPPKLRWATEVEDFAVTYDKAGEPILNAAGDPFDPPLLIPFSTPVAVISRLMREFDHDWITAYKGRINDAEWLGWPAGSVLCKEITADREWLPDVEGYGWAVEYQLAFRPPILDESDVETVHPGWSIQVLNAGLREKVGSDRKPIILDGAPVSSPVPLKSDGTKAGPSDDPVYLTFDVYPEADFSALGLPSDLFTVGTPEI